MARHDDPEVLDVSKQESPGEQDQTTEPTLASVALRDFLHATVALCAWAGAEAWVSVSGLMLATGLSIAAAIAAGWTLAALLHEWGHYAGARLSSAVAPRVQPAGLAFFRYQFDLQRNSLAQFTAMSIGGNLAHWGLVAAGWLLLPMETLGQAALVGAFFAFAVFASVIEWPIMARTLGRKIAPAAAFDHLNRRFIRQRYVVGGIGGILFALTAAGTL